MSRDDLRPLDLDWYGTPVPGHPRWRLAVEGADLVLRGAVDVKPTRVPGDAPGRFVEGLWDGDLVEAFLLNPANGFYLELNLAPRGAWWACAHTAPRVRVPGGAQPLDGGRTRLVDSEERWDTTLRVPLASMPPELAFDPATTRGNVTICIGSPQRYLTVADLGGGTPDFHRPECWVPLAELLS